MARTILILGTSKGAFLVAGDAARPAWDLSGPFCEGWPINHAIGDPATGTVWAGGGDGWRGPGVWRSTDLGATWTRHAEGLTLPGETKAKGVWSLARDAAGRLWAGIEPAELFRSTDGGETWSHVPGLSAHPSRPDWVPGGAGLTLHHIVPDPKAPGRLHVGISTAGVFATEDDGRSWEARNLGTRIDFFETEGEPTHGQCVHAIAKAAGPGETWYQQNHCGMYRSRDGGRRWESIEAGLPSSFGFPVVAHPRETGTLWLFPLVADLNRIPPGGRPAVWRSRDGGASWEALGTGLPARHAYFAVLRQAMATDGGDPAGLYFGTSTGSLFASRDEGGSWTEIAAHLPVIQSVEAMTLP